MKKLFTSESVTEGHPDKVADYIADSILDATLEIDPYSRVACEVAVTTDYCLVFGEITTNAKLDYEQIVREAVRTIGFDKDEYGFNANTITIDIRLDLQSSDIALGVDRDGAGDQGIMFGYAIDETEELMPLAISLSNKISKRLAFVRKNDIIKGIRPDGKCQVTVLYDDNGKPLMIDTVVLSTQHDPDIVLEELICELHKHVFDVVLPKELVSSSTKFLVNPTGRFVIGGPNGDSGLTGRKLVVDTYGGYARNGGGALSGKDATKVDRSAAYMARYIAKNIVGSKIAKEVEIQFAYAIGVSKPVSVYVNAFNTSKVSEEELIKAIIDNFDLSPRGIIETLKLRTPIYKQTAAYGHFGKNEFTWEQLDKVEVFKNLK